MRSGCARAGLAPRSGTRQVGAEIEQIVLDARQHGIDGRRAPRARAGAPRRCGVGLVRRCRRRRCAALLRYALAGAERRGAGVARAGVDLVEDDHARQHCSALACRRLAMPPAVAERPAGSRFALRSLRLQRDRNTASIMDHDGQKLQADAPAHELLAQVGAGAAHHVPQAGQQHDEDRRARPARSATAARLSWHRPVCSCGQGVRRTRRVSNFSRQRPGAWPRRRQLTHATIGVISLHSELRRISIAGDSAGKQLRVRHVSRREWATRDAALDRQTTWCVAALPLRCACHYVLGAAHGARPIPDEVRASARERTAAAARPREARPRSCRRTSTRSPPSASASMRAWSRPAS